jgi:lipopolysaccharide/colanic/teichoic acid biosynthesis glycosyltransferase
MVDVVLSLLGLVLFSIPMLGFAVWIRYELGKPVLFRQVRIGQGGRPFTILKFRTMAQDKQIGPFRRWLRRTAMDELPQLINILRGEMSFVGPRPLIPEELQHLASFPNGERRLSVRPGLTGLAQLCGPKVPTLEQRLGWDLAYVEQCSFWLDVKLLVRSVGVTLRRGWGE